MSNLVVAQLLFLESENPEKDISIYINSPGGSISSGLQYMTPCNLLHLLFQQYALARLQVWVRYFLLEEIKEKDMLCQIQEL